MKILIAEDFAISAELLTEFLEESGYDVTVAGTGREALRLCQKDDFAVIFTDWRMPEMDGLELIAAVRETVRPAPIIIMITACKPPREEIMAQGIGADEYLTKPFSMADLLRRLEACLARKGLSGPKAGSAPPSPLTSHSSEANDEFPIVVVGASTGGPPVLQEFIGALPANFPAAVLVALHGPGWMLQTFTHALSSAAALPVKLARAGVKPRPATIYLAPGDLHLTVRSGPKLYLSSSDPVNHVRPAADVLFRSAAKVFGSRCVAVVVTGMGVDGAEGALAIHQAGGEVLVQDPTTALVDGMPKATLALVPEARSCPPERLASSLVLALQRVCS